jgi:hypothetical protein
MAPLNFTDAREREKAFSWYKVLVKTALLEHKGT